MPGTKTRRANRAHSAVRRATPTQPNADGWLTVRHRVDSLSACEVLSAHADWSGPLKLERDHDEVWQPWSVAVRSVLRLGGSEMCDEESAAGEQRLLRDLAALANDPFQSFAGWEPPAANLLAGWLAEAGREAQIDDAGNLRLVVKRHACDGQIRVERRTGRLRFVLPLGGWTALSDAARAAVIELADEANSRTALARVAWIEEPDRCRCEGQVDLTGLPLPAQETPERLEFWRLMTGLAVDGLEILLRRLGLELDVLAEERQHAVRELMRGSRAFRE
jgi:hypothetical protein